MPTIEMKTELPGPKSRAIIERKERVVCDPLDLHVNAVIDHGFGAAVTDVDGNTMLDLSSGLGCLLALTANGYTTGASNLQTFREVAYAFRITPAIIGAGMTFALVMGILGGLLPSVRAARLSIAAAVREG